MWIMRMGRLGGQAWGLRTSLTGGAWGRVFWVLGVLLAVRELEAQEQAERLLGRTAPYAPFAGVEEQRYNLRWGRLTGRLHSSVQVEASDNVNLSEDDPEFDVMMGPEAGVGFLWPVTRGNILQFDLGAGYRYYASHPELSSVYVTPGTRLNFRMTVEEVQIAIYNAFSIALDPTTRADISGVDGDVLEFQRLHNGTGLEATWQMNSRWTASAGYEFAMDRSLSGEFTSLDRDTHGVSAAVFNRVAREWTVGIAADASRFRHSEPVQNDGMSYSAGPVIGWQATSYILVDATIGYSAMRFESTGSLADAEDFQGPAYQVGMHHRMNSRMTQEITFRQRATVGFGSNYSESRTVQYAWSAKLTSAIGARVTAAYESFGLSGAAGERAERYLAQLSVDYQLTRLWRTSAAYGYSLKDSEMAGRGYSQNRFTVNVSRAF